jgi:hypothetical protein
MMARHPSELRKRDRIQSPTNRRGSKGRSSDGGDYKGLCVNCANRETCLLPKAEGGVWHCEEYVEDR